MREHLLLVLPALLSRLGIWLLGTTYQFGRLVILRADGDALNTHVRAFPKPMGLAAQGDQRAVGGAGVNLVRRRPGGTGRSDHRVRPLELP
jgi:hypothetical protein